MNPTGQTEPVVYPTLQEIKNAAILAALARHRGNRSAAARELGVQTKTIYNIIKREGLCPKPS